ncbi:hypothetical protein [Streptomyces jumonjinensis]|uniref:hypothetical protein n=1 Tax=Streptomyces jumonjinensis TaxID=1945 RepID=UPI00378C8E15
MPESYPDLPAGRRITGSLLRAMLPLTARKTADTSRAATTTAAPDPHLYFDVAAGGVYTLSGWISYDGPAAADLTLDFSAPAGSQGEWTGWGPGVATVVGASTVPVLTTDTSSPRGYMTRMEPTDVTAARTFGCINVGTPLTVTIWGTLRVGPVGGTYSLDWAQVTSDAGAVTLYADSWLSLRRIA